MIYQLLTTPDDKDIPLILSVYRLPSVSRFVSIDEDNYWQYVTSADYVSFYKVYENNRLVATIHCELVEHILYMSVVVFPEYQRLGIATKILKDIQNGKLNLYFDAIKVSIDEKNIGSLKLFEKSGFICKSKDDELFEYEYIKK